MIPNIGVILAGGIGARLGTERPKQLLEVAGKTILQHTVDVFQHCPQIHEIALVLHADIYEEVQQFFRQHTEYNKVRHFLYGGRERHHSTLSALSAYRDQEVNLIFHDAARPCLTSRLINSVCHSLETHEAVNVVLPPTDTIIEVDEQGAMQAVPSRSRLRRVQTPQGFRADTLRCAYEIALTDNLFESTDDCSVVFRYLPQTPIALVPGEETNLKLTFLEDLNIIEHHLGRLSRY